MVDHAALGCICFWCEDAGAVHPFVMAKRPFKAGIPVAQVVYCPPGSIGGGSAAPSAGPWRGTGCSCC